MDADYLEKCKAILANYGEEEQIHRKARCTGQRNKWHKQARALVSKNLLYI